MVRAVSAIHDPASALPAAASDHDVLSDVLRSVRLTGSMLFLVDAGAPFLSWAPRADSIRRVTLPAAQHLISYHIVTQGSCWGGLKGQAPHLLTPGDVLVVPHGDAYYLADPPDAAASYGDDEAMAFFRAMAAGALPSTISQGSDAAARTQFVCGFLGCDQQPFNPVLAALPPLLVLKAASGSVDRMRHLTDFALGELRQRSSGSRDVLLRLSELMFVEVVRQHLQSLTAAQNGWLAGLNDALVGRCLALLHGAPERPWTLTSLAAQAGASRSVVAERFARFVGQPPMQYLTHWRLQLATRLLDQPGSKVVAVAAAVGYASEAAFSRAFKKFTGVSPARWRRCVAG
ncbi:MAG: AraC family transcriptional regulator [Burkholderiaceae bacterium]